MKRELNKIINLDERMKQLEEAEQKRFEEIEEIRKKDFRNNNDELDTAFYFSVVFNSRSERDKWCMDHHINLTEDFFIKASDFDDAMKL